jgi:iron-sulfur cluster repair protein YtfE (RIC family)
VIVHQRIDPLFSALSAIFSRTAMAKPVHITSPTEQPSASTTELAKLLNDCLDQQKLICAKLEKIADALPAIDDAATLEILNSLPGLLLMVHEFEESHIFPLVLEDGQRALTETIDRLKQEHVGDEDYAEDVCSAIQTYLTQKDRAHAESLSWMLRGFFESIRRHIAFEREHILPLASRIENRNST